MPRLLASVLLAIATAPLAAQQPRSFTLAGADVAIYNLAGAVTVAGGSGSAVAVEVTTVGADAGQLKIETGDVRGRPTLRVIYPDDRIVYPALGRGSSSSFSVRDDGTWGGSGGDWKGRAEGHKVTIRGEGSGLEAAANLKVTLPEGKRLSLFIGAGRVDVTNIDGDLRVDAAAADVAAHGTKGRLGIDTGSGEIRLEGASGSITLDTGSGDISAHQVSAGDLDVETGSGSVEMTGVTVTALAIETGSGDIEMDAIATPRLTMETGSGDVKAVLQSAPELLRAETGSGSVTIRLPEGTGASVELETGSGEFRLGFPLQLVRKGDGTLRGTFGDGHGRIEIETGSGDISLER